jgi:hypothetical protein
MRDLNCGASTESNGTRMDGMDQAGKLAERRHAARP